MSLREKLVKEATSRVKEKQRNRAAGSQQDGQAPGKLVRGLLGGCDLGGFGSCQGLFACEQGVIPARIGTWL